MESQYKIEEIDITSADKCVDCIYHLISRSHRKAFDKANKIYQILKEIKAIAERAIAKQQEYKKDFEQIIDLITKVESEG